MTIPQGPPGDPRDDTVTAVLGPTNTGKTHFAIERMLGHASGVMGFPLRLLAREVYDRIVALRGPRAVALITGEEKINPPDAQYILCTVESMPLDWGAAFVAVDEIQLCADPDRGHVFTDRLLRARGAQETLFLGAESMRARIAALIPKARFVTRPRFSTLEYAGSKKVSRLPPRSAVVAFSVESVYAIAELLRRQKGGAAVVMGALSPRTRNAQVALYQNGDVEHLVATDAIGMGLNLDLRHVAFAGLTKFDGRRHRALGAQELAQIAGRAGRHVTDGTFGVTGEAAGIEPDVVERIVTHRFDPSPKLSWRNARLEFGTVEALLASLEAPPTHPDLLRAREADDVAALRLLWTDSDLRDMARGGPAVRLLWEVCQTPDFRKTAPAEHAGLLSRIFRFLQGETGVIPSDWIEAQVVRLDRIDGDIDALSRRLAHVRTWSYVANRGRWLDDPAAWRDRTRALEDRLSDALHDRLTQRFVDRRTSVLMQRLKQKERLVAEVSDTGDVTVEGLHVGRLEGFRFRPDAEAGAGEMKTLKAASLQALQAHFAHRADRFYNAPDTEIDVTDQGGLMWGTEAVGRLEAGPDQLSPQTRAFVDEAADPMIAEKVARRLGHWIDRRVKALFEPLTALRDDPAMTGLARGIGFQLIEGLGVLQRRAIADDVKALDQEGRALLRKHGVRFGQHHVFLPALLKPAPTRFRLLLWALHAKFDEFPSAPPPGLVTIAATPGAPEGFYTRAGYRLCGQRALRIDMLERLADILRQRDARAGFESSPDMLSITGCTLDQFAELMKGLGFAAERGERPKVARGAATAAAAAPVEPADAPDAAVAADAPDAAVAADAPDAAVAADMPEGASAPGAPEVVALADDDIAPTVAVADVAEAPAAAQAEVEGETMATPGAPADADADPSEPSHAGEDGRRAVEIEAFYVFRTAPRRPPRQQEGGQGDAPRRARPLREGEQPSQRPRHGGHGQDRARPDAARAQHARQDGAPQDAPPTDAPRPEAAEAPRRDGQRRREDHRPRHGDGDRPRGDRPQGDQPQRERGHGAERPQRENAPGGDAQKARARTEAGAPPRRDAGPNQKPPRRAETPQAFTASPPADRRTADPDSPFAILKQLRDKL